MEIKGYKYDTEAEGQVASDSLNAYYGIPVSPDDVTQKWVEVEYPTADDKYYIIWDASLNVVLGEPEDIELATPPTS